MSLNTKNFKLNMPVAHILTNPSKDWDKILKDIQGKNRYAFKKINVNWKKYNPFDYLFSHVSIVCSVATDETGYRIVEPCDELVNANGNAWTNAVLPHCFRTFIGGYNFEEHCQIPELSKGIILDAVMRPIVHVGKNGKKANVFMVDLLIATNRKNVDLVSRIESGRLNTLSMGGICNVSQCSICGKLIREGEENCIHLDRYLKQYVTCSDGKKHICAELCFTSDTKVVIADQSLKDIKDIEVGEFVFTHIGKVNKVINKFERKYEGDLVCLNIDRTPTLKSTPNHPYLIAINEKTYIWKEAKDIKKGDILVKPKYLSDKVSYELFPVMSISIENYNGFVYNIEVEKEHSYLVNGIAVHNCGAIDPKTGEYIKDSFVFIEASWVGNPAFKGAVVNYFIDSEQHKNAEKENQKIASIWDDNNLLKIRVADVYTGIALRIANKEVMKYKKNKLL